MAVQLFVGNLDPKTSEQQLARYFLTAGMEVRARIPRDGASGQSRGFGFVEFESEEQAERALVVFDGRKLGQRALRLERAFEREEEADRPAGNRPKRNGDDGKTGASRQSDDYAGDRGVRKRRHGKHGSDRVRGRGTRRVID